MEAEEARETGMPLTNDEQIGSSGTNTSSTRIGKSAGAKWLWKGAEVGLFVAGMVLLAIFGAARLDSYLGSRAALKALAALDEAAEQAPPQEHSRMETASVEGMRPNEMAKTDFRDWDEGRVRAFKAGAAKHDGEPLAVLEIPSIHLLTPLFEGTDALTLNRGVGRIGGTAKPGETGNIGIAGHRDGFFRGLKDVKQGDTIELKLRDSMDVYTIERIQIVSPRDVSVLRPQRSPAVTLVTCYPFYFVGSAPQRYVLTGYLTHHTPIARQTPASR